MPKCNASVTSDEWCIVNKLVVSNYVDNTKCRLGLCQLKGTLKKTEQIYLYALVNMKLKSLIIKY